MAENDYKINIALGTSFDPAGLEQAQQQLEKLKPADATATQAATEAERELTKAREESAEAAQQAAEAGLQVQELLTTEAQGVEELVEVKEQNAEADAKEQRAMKLATKSRNELIQTLKRLQKELKAAAEAQDVEQYRAVEQEIAETRGAFEKQNQVLELNNIQMGQQAQNGIMVANTLAGMAKGLQDGSLSAGDFASGFMAISAAMKAGLGPIGWVMLAIQGLQAAWDYFSAESKKEEETRKKRWEDMQRLAEITDEARTALENYNRTKLSNQQLEKIRGTYADINRELERQIKNIQRATDAELARLAITQDEQEHKRSMQRAKLGRQLAAGTISQEEYEQALFDMEQSTQMQGLDDEVRTKQLALQAAEAKLAEYGAAWDKKSRTHARISKKRAAFGSELEADKMELMLTQFNKLQKEVDEAWEAQQAALREDDEDALELARQRYKDANEELAPLRAQIEAAYTKVHGEGAQAKDGLLDAEALAALIHERKSLDKQYETAEAELKNHRNTATAAHDAVETAKRDLAEAEAKRSRELGQMADARAEEEKDRALQKLLAEKQKAATELAKMETTELRRLQKEAQKRAKAAREAGDADGAAVLEKLATLYKDEIALRSTAAKNKAAVDAARNKAEAAAPSQDKLTDDVLREAQQLANRIAKGEALDGRSAEQLLALWKQAQASKDKKDDAFVAQLIALMQLQADVGAGLQAEVRKLKRKTEKLTSRNFD